MSLSESKHVLQDVTTILAGKWKLTVLKDFSKNSAQIESVFDLPLEDMVLRKNELSDNVLALVYRVNFYILRTLLTRFIIESVNRF